LFLLVGADSLRDLPHWRNPSRILELATVVAVNRGDRLLPHGSQLHGVVGTSADERVIVVTMPGIDISATDIRGRVRDRRSIRYLVPRAVEMYISQHSLFETAIEESMNELR
jgi:nicotinate-nucleotide adenylyltransferase